MCTNVQAPYPMPVAGTVEDKLNRQPLAQNLTDIANIYADTGAVIALDGEWGSGKTTFVRMWHQMLLDRTYKSIYFNAWNTDFQDDPFIAIMSELDEVFQKSKTFSKDRYLLLTMK